MRIQIFFYQICIIKKFLELGYKIDETALIQAVNLKNYILANLFIEFGADINQSIEWLKNPNNSNEIFGSMYLSDKPSLIKRLELLQNELYEHGQYVKSEDN